MLPFIPLAILGFPFRYPYLIIHSLIFTEALLDLVWLVESVAAQRSLPITGIPKDPSQRLGEICKTMTTTNGVFCPCYYR